MPNDFCVIIPAFKAHVAFPNDLLKYLAGKTLIRRAIDRAKKLVGPKHIYVVTDSSEVAMVCERAGIRICRQEGLTLESRSIMETSSSSCFAFKRNTAMSSSPFAICP